MARLTLTSAIKQSPVGRTQFYAKYLDSGLITVSVDNKGKKYIDSSELLRVFGELKGEPSANVREQLQPNNTEQPKPNNTEQSEQIKLLKNQLMEASEREKFYQSQIISLTHRLEGPSSQRSVNPLVKWWRGLK